MDVQLFLNFVFGAVSILFTFASFMAGWILNNITKSLDRLDRDVRDMPKVYVTKEDYRLELVEIKDLLGKIFDRLDGKADK